MDYCGPRGIPYGKFLDWSQLSRDAALAYQARENARCGSCGQVKADWMTEGDDGEPVELVPPPLVVGDHWCPGCAALETRRRHQGKDERPPGVTLGFKVNEAAAQA